MKGDNSAFQGLDCEYRIVDEDEEEPQTEYTEDHHTHFELERKYLNDNNCTLDDDLEHIPHSPSKLSFTTLNHSTINNTEIAKLQDQEDN
jgi:hypothetical protein